MKRLLLFATVLVLMLALAAPAFAVSGAGGAGRSFALDHVVVHAQEMGFDGVMNPGRMHHGFSGFPGEMPH